MLYVDPTVHASSTPQHGKTVLLVGRPGHLRDALLSLLSTLPELSAIHTAESGLLALGIAGQRSPDLLLIASGLPEAETPELVRQFKQNWPATPCLVLAENTRQVERARQAGATRVMHASAPSRQFLSEISTLFQA